jgi:hydrogenase maturation protein HypF
MPGGDRATRHPARLAAGLLYAAEGETDGIASTLQRHDVAFPGGDEERDLVCQQLDAGINTPVTSSAGRFLDAVSALCGVCTERTYEGEPAMKLEAVAARGTPKALGVPRTTVDGRSVVDTPRLFMDVVAAREDGASGEEIAATAQDVLARGLGDIAVAGGNDRGRGAVALSGGVAYNDHIVRRIRKSVTDAGLEFLGNERVPPGDGGIAYGQLAVAAARTE